LADAVGFIDREKVGLYPRDKFLEISRAESFGGHVKESPEALVQFLHGLAAERRAQRTVQKYCGNSLIAQLLNLILHQRNEWGDDDRQPAMDDCRELIAQALARSGWHDTQDVFTAQDIFNDLPLRGTKVIEPKEILEVFPEIRHVPRIISREGGRGHHHGHFQNGLPRSRQDAKKCKKRIIPLILSSS
jgi:hypothetical protein